jgi:hypothetical protein
MKKLAFALPLLALASCGGQAPQTFKPLDYSYLPPILLKVSNVNVVNSYVPTPSQTQMAGMDPAPPSDTLMTMLYQRLKPAGQPGTATVTVQTAYVDNVAGNLTGALTVDLNLASADGRSTGFTEASVSASQTAPDSGNPDDMRAALYALTKQLMTQMNVQLQYQIQKNLPSWVSWTSAGMGPAAGPAAGSAAGSMIQAAPLTAPPGVATTTPMGTSGATAAPAPVPTPPSSTAGVPTYLPGAGPAALGSAP